MSYSYSHMCCGRATNISLTIYVLSNYLLNLFRSALLGFLLLLTTVKLKSGLTLEESRTWTFLSKVMSFFDCCK